MNDVDELLAKIAAGMRVRGGLAVLQPSELALIVLEITTLRMTVERLRAPPPLTATDRCCTTPEECAANGCRKGQV